MAMEERQTKIREGAGLEEGRLNTEFIDMMKKWGPHLVTALAVLALLYFGYDKYTKWKATTNDVAFVDLSAAATSASPANLESVARDHAGTTVAMEARLYAADLHMSAARTGIPIGEKFDDKDPTKLAADKPFLSDDLKKQELAEAERLYQGVVADANSSTGQTLLAIGALNGLASVAEDRVELDKAKSFYQQAMAKANAAKFDKLEALIKKRLDSIDSLKEAPKLYAAAELPGGIDKPVTVPMGGVTARTATGETITIGPGGAITPGPAASTVPASPSGTTPVTLPGGGTLNLTPVAPPTAAPAPTAVPAPAPTADPAKPATP
jgi:hypothetical protein